MIATKERSTTDLLHRQPQAMERKARNRLPPPLPTNMPYSLCQPPSLKTTIPYSAFSLLTDSSKSKP
ncbi:hypothetical protein RIF29_19634 [Crotalaria pallida]|uniref:Uncharacterized protein n=1 Tax=Crotalaria pallida TaxID=3830 RepID=A0AAN9EZS3_CROPI